MNKRTFSKEEKLRIVKEASEQGVKAVLDKYDIYPVKSSGVKSFSVKNFAIPPGSGKIHIFVKTD